MKYKAYIILYLAKLLTMAYKMTMAEKLCVQQINIGQ